MKLCRNCRTINESSAEVCARCKMRDQLIDYNPEKTRQWSTNMQEENNVKQLYNVCKNCGTPDFGEGQKCARCHFPITIKQRNSGPMASQRKVK